MKHNVELKVCEHPSCLVPYIDGERLPFCERIDHSKDLEKEGVMKFSASEHAFALCRKEQECDLSAYVKIATLILRDELLKHGDLYKGFVASVLSVIKPKSKYIGDGETEILAEFGENYLAEEIVKRIIGEE